MTNSRAKISGTGTERPWAVGLMRRLDAWRDLATGRPIYRMLRQLRGDRAWPVTSGAYVVGDPTAPVAVCTLTSNDLVRPLAGLPGVAIAGRVYTPNLGIEKIVLNVTANPSIRYLLLAGRDSPVFHPGQAIRSLFENGVDGEQRIIGARGYLPVLGKAPRERVEAFRHQVELIDLVDETSVDVLSQQVRAIVERGSGHVIGEWRARWAATARSAADSEFEDATFVSIRPGGKREPLSLDPKGFFVITLDEKAGEIVLRHYLPDNTPAHLMRGRTAESMLLGLAREGLISQLSHAGYLGVELARAEAALRLGWSYEQDRPLRPAE